MKIISKYKEEYDFLMGVYGVDPLIVLDRSSGMIVNIPSDVMHFCLIIGGYTIEGFYMNQRFYYGNDLAMIGKRPTRKHALCTKSHYLIDIGKHTYRVSDVVVKDAGGSNMAEECPILFSQFLPRRHSLYSFTKYPRLSDFKLFSYMSPDKVYHMISDYISNMVDEKQAVITTITNSNKIISKGFDLKTSFRPNIKSDEAKN